MVLEKIKKIRIEKGISHEAMAYNLGITQAAYTKIEKNETKLSVDRLYRIAEILEVEVSDLLGIEIQKVYKQEFNDNAHNYQDFQNLYQENKEMYQELLKAKDEQIAMLKEMIKELKNKT